MVSQIAAKSILIVHQGAIGDFILSLPALEAIHRFYSEARFNFLGRPAILEIICSRPYFNEVLDWAESRWAPLYHSNPKLQTAAYVTLPPVERIFAFCRTSGQILADNLASLFGKPSHRIDPFPDPSFGLSVSDYQCQQLEELGIPATPAPAAVIAPSQQDLLEVRGFVQQNVATGKQLVLLHPGSGGRKKLWRPAGWLNILKRLLNYNKLQIVLLQGPADTHVVRLLRSQLEMVPLITVKNWNLGKVSALMSQASLYLGNDSGITHLAAACTTPTIALFGPTDPQIWGPQGPRVKIICWQPEYPAHDLQTASGNTWESRPETELVWEQARKWLRI